MSAIRAFALIAVLGVVVSTATNAVAEIAIPVIEDMNNAGAVEFGGGVNIYNFGAGTSFNDEAVDNGNDLVVYTFDAPSNSDGMGFSVSISNGENGITSSEGGANTDIENTTPADSVFTTIGNSSGKLENGNALRASVWMRQDPNSPVVTAPQIEPIFKFELWKEALSDNQDTTAAAAPNFGDRVWDTDQNAAAPEYGGSQSLGSWVDMNNDGVTSFGNPVAVSLVTDEWRLVETTIVIDDDPLSLGGWTVAGLDFFTVADIEEVRASMFLGDFVGTDLTGAGSMWVDNLMLEVFADEATMLATANANPMPSAVAGLAGDYNNDNVVDAADYTVWRDGDSPDSSQAGYDAWVNNFGATLPSSSQATSVPEPTTALLLLMAMATVGRVTQAR